MSEGSLAEPQMNATPLIDVLLVLLVMLIFTVPIATHAVKLNLPYGPSEAPSANVLLDISWDGALYWNGLPVDTVDGLLPHFAAVARLAAPPLVSVIPEKRAPYGRVAEVLAAAQRSGVTRLSVAPISDLTAGLP